MTSTAAIALAFSLFINGITLFYNSSQEQYFASKLVFLMAVALLLKRIDPFPTSVRTKFEALCFSLEIPVTLLLLEYSLIYVWQWLQDFVLLHTDDLLALMLGDERLEWLVCHLCCGKNDCSIVSARLVLKLISFSILLFVCCILRIKR